MTNQGRMPISHQVVSTKSMFQLVSTGDIIGRVPVIYMLVLKWPQDTNTTLKSLLRHEMAGVWDEGVPTPIVCDKWKSDNASESLKNPYFVSVYFVYILVNIFGREDEPCTAPPPRICQCRAKKVYFEKSLNGLRFDMQCNCNFLPTCYVN